MIQYIEFENHRILGNLKLDFAKNENEAYNTIVFAGENGSGKTAILNAVAGFQRGSYLSDFSSEKEVTYFDLDGIKHSILRSDEKKRYSKTEEIPDDKWVAPYPFSEHDFYREKNELLEEMPYDIRNRSVVFSEARSGFEVNLPKNEYWEDYEKNGSDYSCIVQLLMDLEDKDNEEYLAYAKVNRNCTYEEYMTANSRTARFKRAFEKMFEGLKYVGRDLNAKDMIIYFSKDGKQIDINDLSTGEKQIVFRGTDLLHHARAGATVFIDEPELSLHPKWQKKILEFYRNLFVDENGRQFAQLLVATHSQYVIQSAIKDSENVKIILLKSEKQEIIQTKMDEILLGPYSVAEVNYLTFGVEGKEYHIQLFGALHNLLQETDGSGVDGSILSIDRYISHHELYNYALHEMDDITHNHYHTICVYVRNAIDHPDSGRRISDSDLKISIDLLRRIYKSVIERQRQL